MQIFSFLLILFDSTSILYCILKAYCSILLKYWFHIDADSVINTDNAINLYSYASLCYFTMNYANFTHVVKLSQRQLSSFLNLAKHFSWSNHFPFGLTYPISISDTYNLLVVLGVHVINHYPLNTMVLVFWVISLLGGIRKLHWHDFEESWILLPLHWQLTSLLHQP